MSTKEFDMPSSSPSAPIGKDQGPSQHAAVTARFARLLGICHRILWTDLGVPSDSEQTKAALSDLSEFLFMDAFEALSAPHSDEPQASAKAFLRSGATEGNTNRDVEKLIERLTKERLLQNAMALNYRDGHHTDHLDIEAFERARDAMREAAQALARLKEERDAWQSRAADRNAEADKYAKRAWAAETALSESNRRIEELKKALLNRIRRENGCHIPDGAILTTASGNDCHGWDATHCGCAAEARTALRTYADKETSK